MKLNDLRQQTEFDCGDTARTVALLGAGYPKRLVKSLPPISTPEHGTPPRRMALLLRRNGIKARLHKRLTLAKAEKLMAAGFTLVCPVAGKDNGHDWHWITLQRVSETLVTYHDPFCGFTSKSKLDFLDWWEDTDYRGERWQSAAVVIPRYVRGATVKDCLTVRQRPAPAAERSPKPASSRRSEPMRSSERRVLRPKNRRLAEG